LATLKRQEKRRYGSISRGGVFFASWRTWLAISLRRAKPRTCATVRPLLSSRTYPACDLPSLPRACPEKAQLFSVLTCANSLILNSVLIDQMISFDRDALYGGSASVKLRFVRALALQMELRDRKELLKFLE
jgi:hypothetical protein